MTADQLDRSVRRELRSLPKGLADMVSAHLVAAGQRMEEEPDKALEHARFARQCASRIGVVREANGIAAYHAGQWAETLTEMRAARRMGGSPGNLAVMADAERALGRPERALELTRGPEARELSDEDAVELRIVAAGARRDLGQVEAAVVALQTPELDRERNDPWSARLFYAYADNLLAAGRQDEALRWFLAAADADDSGETDAEERLQEWDAEWSVTEADPEDVGDEGAAEQANSGPPAEQGTDAGMPRDADAVIGGDFGNEGSDSGPEAEGR